MSNQDIRQNVKRAEIGTINQYDSIENQDGGNFEENAQRTGGKSSLGTVGNMAEAAKDQQTIDSSIKDPT